MESFKIPYAGTSSFLKPGLIGKEWVRIALEQEKIESGLKKTGMTLKKTLKEVNKEKFFLKKKP